MSIKRRRRPRKKVTTSLINQTVLPRSLLTTRRTKRSRRMTSRLMKKQIRRPKSRKIFVRARVQRISLKRTRRGDVECNTPISILISL